MKRAFVDVRRNVFFLFYVLILAIYGCRNLIDGGDPSMFRPADVCPRQAVAGLVISSLVNWFYVVVMNSAFGVRCSRLACCSSIAARTVHGFCMLLFEIATTWSWLSWNRFSKQSAGTCSLCLGQCPDLMSFFNRNRGKFHQHYMLFSVRQQVRIRRTWSPLTWFCCGNHDGEKNVSHLHGFCRENAIALFREPELLN